MTFENICLDRPGLVIHAASPSTWEAEASEFDLSSRSARGSQFKTQMNKQQQNPTASWLKRSNTFFHTIIFPTQKKITNHTQSLVCSLFCDHRGFKQQILCKNFCLYYEIHPQYTTVA